MRQQPWQSWISTFFWHLLLNKIFVSLSPLTCHSRPLTFFLPVPSTMVGCCQMQPEMSEAPQVRASLMEMTTHFSAAICPRKTFQEPWWDLNLKKEKIRHVVLQWDTVWDSSCNIPVVVNNLDYKYLLVLVLVLPLSPCLCLDVWFWVRMDPWTLLISAPQLMLSLCPPKENCIRTSIQKNSR